jgi:pimeloyl-ACP methyl ester carboxylesterase
MDDRRTHRTTSDDGTPIAGHVIGQGPPLVLVHGSLEDGDLGWDALIPHLRHRFTCYQPSTRNRGLSGACDDLSPQRRLEDLVSFVDSVGESVLLFGESDGGALALGAAARSDNVAAIGAYEPTVLEVVGEDLDRSLQETMSAVGQAVADGRPAEAARIFGELVANDDELAALINTGYLQEAGRYIPVFLQEVEQANRPEALSPTDASLLEVIEVPVLLQRGTRSALYDWMTDGTRHVAEHVADARVQEIAGAGHFAAALAAEVVADQLSGFFNQVPMPA